MKDIIFEGMWVHRFGEENYSYIIAFVFKTSFFCREWVSLIIYQDLNLKLKSQQHNETGATSRISYF